MSYTLSSEKYIRDIKCTARVYTHDKTGARVVVMPSEDNNKAISIAFSTPAENDKGIPHIIEHSVLCGSAKYPLKDPFVQLMKGSMYSFLNAMTSSDFTVYPVASTNDKDFKNLADVYLDAVFNPLLPQKKEIFLQEGKHFEVDAEKKQVLGFNGVVYNEMRGMEGSADFHIMNASMAALFSGTPYQYESGGIPLAVGDLEYDELCDFYRRHYNASNSVIFLYGNIDEQEMLSYIDAEYLSSYEQEPSYHIDEISVNPKTAEKSVPYPADSESIEKGYYYAYTFAVHEKHNPIMCLTLRVLDRILCSAQGAFVKQALQKEGIGEDFYSIAEEMTACPFFSFVGAYCRESEKDKFKSVIDTVLSNLAENGIDKERLNSAIRMLEFQEKEISEGWLPKGIEYAMQVLPKFLYNEENPLEMLEFFDAIDKLKELAKTDYFEQFIKKNFIENTHRAFVTAYPDCEFAQREDKLLNEKCAENSKQFSFDALADDYNALNAYRNSSDTKEQAEKIPLLERSDLSPEPNRTLSKKFDVSGREMLFQNKNTNGIAYIDLMFDLRTLSPELLPYYRIFTELFGNMNTAKHSYSELSSLIDNYTGGIYHSLQITDAQKNGGELAPYMNWHCRFLYENADKALDINREILLETDYSDTAHIYDLLLQLKTVMTRDLLEASHKSAKGIGLAKYSGFYALDYKLQGYGFYKFLCSVLNDFESEKESLVEKMQAINAALLNPACWRISYVGGDEFVDGAVDYCKRFLELMKEDGEIRLNSDISLSDKNSLALYSSSQVQYAALCGTLPEEADDKRGYLLVLQHLLSTDYLWQNIRVLGGAYGCMLSFDNIGTACMVSYRDPNLDETIACFKNVVDYINSLELEERELRQFIIGAMNKLDMPKTPYADGALAIQTELCGISLEKTAETRRQIISATLDDIKALAPIIERFIETATEVVIGNEQTIKASQIRFDEIKPLI